LSFELALWSSAEELIKGGWTGKQTLSDWKERICSSYQQVKQGFSTPRSSVVSYVRVALFFARSSDFFGFHSGRDFFYRLGILGFVFESFVWPSATRLRQKTTQSVRRVTVASCKRQDNASNSGKSRERELHASAASCVVLDLLFVLLVAQSTWLKLGYFAWPTALASMSATPPVQKVGQALTRELWAELETEDKARKRFCFKHFGTRHNYEPIVFSVNF